MEMEASETDHIAGISYQPVAMAICTFAFKFIFMHVVIHSKPPKDTIFLIDIRMFILIIFIKCIFCK